MSFLDELQAESAQVEALAQETFIAIGDEMFHSIVDGSPLTGSKGVPVRTGALRASFVETLHSPTQIAITSDDPKGIFVEEDARRIQFKNGGAHFIKKSVAGFPNIVRAVAGPVGFDV